MRSEAIIGAVKGVTKKWAKQRKQEEREASARANRHARLTSSHRVTIKDAAYACMEQAYLKASASGTLPANARQIMYAARPSIQDATGKQLDDQYFCQTLLPDYIDETGVDWDVAYDDRGHFVEPHTDCTIGLGTLSVRRYLHDVHAPHVNDVGISSPSVETHGPEGRFGAILFIEKEGFMPLFDAVNLAEQYDIAIMSTKGLSVTAARRLVDDLCGNYDIPLFVLHDFDKSGFSILGTLRRATRRYRFSNSIEVIDLGLRLDDVKNLGLEGENAYDQGDDEAKASNLCKNGATEEEIDFLLHSRVELNALTSDQLIAWIKSKLDLHGVEKVIPDQDTISNAYKMHRTYAAAMTRLEELLAKLMAEDNATVPADLKLQVEKGLRDNPTASWEDIICQIAQAESDV